MAHTQANLAPAFHVQVMSEFEKYNKAFNKIANKKKPKPPPEPPAQSPESCLTIQKHFMPFRVGALGRRTQTALLQHMPQLLPMCEECIVHCTSEAIRVGSEGKAEGEKQGEDGAKAGEGEAASDKDGGKKGEGEQQQQQRQEGAEKTEL
eukprot:1144644-Pelagomonas_calceolata.AAC.1